MQRKNTDYGPYFPKTPPRQRINSTRIPDINGPPGDEQFLASSDNGMPGHVLGVEEKTGPFPGLRSFLARAATQFQMTGIAPNQTSGTNFGEDFTGGFNRNG